MVLNWCPRIFRRLQNPVRIRAEGATTGNVRWLNRPFRPASGSERQLADDLSSGHLRNAGVSQNPEARRRRDGGLAVHPREVRWERGRRLALDTRGWREIFAAGSIVGIAF
ncbi:unnamed protein product [Ectocarpus sp. 8 AP-2014]